MKKMLARILNPMFISIYTEGKWELGVRIWGLNFIFYKGDSLYWRDEDPWMKATQRAYGVSIHPTYNHKKGN